MSFGRHLKTCAAICLFTLTPALRAIADDAPALRARLQSQLATVTSAFVHTGGKCSIGVPSLSIGPTPSFGSYDDASNVLHVAAWDDLSPAEQQQFVAMAGSADKAAGQSLYEDGVYNWVFVHELGHWWQQCRSAKADHYAREAGANRVAAAYWRLRDPVFLAREVSVLSSIRAKVPNPVPKGQDAVEYFDTNYDTLGYKPGAYIWYQASMVNLAFTERPSPSLRQALADPVHYPVLAH